MTDTAPDASSTPHSQVSDFRRRARLPLMIGGPVLVVLIAGWFWLTGGRYVSTDDANVQTGRVPISANISAHVVELDVRENQRVKAGQVLFRLDPSAAEASLAEAQARLAGAHAQLEGYQAAYEARRSELSSTQATAALRQSQLQRDKTLLIEGIMSRQDYDAAANEAQLSAQAVDVAKQMLKVAAASLGGSAPPSGGNPAVKQARAQLQSAEIIQSDTVIRAPQDGVVTKVSQLQVGSYVNAAQPVFSLITDDVWIDANFKEGDLAHMRPGQKATVKIDAHPGEALQAEVESISPGTGSSFSLLPPENATGNWVKVVQRVPVRLRFTRRPAIELQGGLSAVVKVDTEYSKFGRHK